MYSVVHCFQTTSLQFERYRARLRRSKSSSEPGSGSGSLFVLWNIMVAGVSSGYRMSSSM